MSTFVRAYTNPKFKNQNVVVGVTLHDNDFSNQLRQFIYNMSYEMTSKCTNKLSTEEKEKIFRDIWNNIIPTLYYMTSIRAFDIKADYDPADHQPNEKLVNYLRDRFTIAFDDNAQKMFDQHGSNGNGEFCFVDINGEIGWS